MKLVLDIVKSGDENLEKRNSHFNKKGGVIGRSQSADWQLTDEKNYISNKHLLIEYLDGSYYVRDESTNGTFLKFPYKKLPKGNRVKINSTDIFIIGDYEIQARFVEDNISTDIVDQALSESQPKDLGLIPDDDFLNEPFDALETDDIDVMKMVGENKKPSYENTISHEELNYDDHDSELNEHHIDIPTATSKENAMSQDIPNTSLQRSLNILEKKLGIEICTLDKNERDLVLEEIGDIILNSLSGLKHSLHVKEKIKEDLNVLKVNDEELHANPILLGESASGLLQKKQMAGMLGFSKISDAILQSFDELDKHNIALHSTSKSLMNITMRKFSPENLEYYFEGKGDLKSPFKSRKVLMWTAYKNMFNEFEKEPEKGIEVISKDFSNEYKDIAYSVKLATKKRSK